MARYDVFKNPDGVGWLLDVQTDLLEDLNTRIVVPLLPPPQAPKPARRLNPVFTLAGKDVVMVAQFLSAVPDSVLGKSVDNFAERHDDIIAALDMIIHGF